MTSLLKAIRQHPFRTWVLGNVVILLAFIILLGFRPAYVWMVSEEMNPTALFDPKLFITLWAAEVPISLSLAWLVPILFERRNEERRRIQDAEQVTKRARDERVDKLMTRLNNFALEWPMLREHIIRDDFARTDDPDIRRVRMHGDEIRTALAGLHPTDIGERESEIATDLVNGLVALGDEIVRQWEPMMNRQDETLNSLAQSGDAYRDAAQDLRTIISP